MQTGCFHKAVGPRLRAIRCQSDLANQLYYMYISGLSLSLSRRLSQFSRRARRGKLYFDISNTLIYQIKGGGRGLVEYVKADEGHEKCFDLARKVGRVTSTLALRKLNYSPRNF